MIASFVEENHENWDQLSTRVRFLALRTAVNETTKIKLRLSCLGEENLHNASLASLANVKQEDTKYVGRNTGTIIQMSARRSHAKKA
ncbi:hypothetical protein TNCV_2575131 [Trichonephila clavipes]|nr:hypothetical protein TNCV_2575131 [Trichonephila clavipes]